MKKVVLLVLLSVGLIWPDRSPGFDSVSDLGDVTVLSLDGGHFCFREGKLVFATAKGDASRFCTLYRNRSGIKLAYMANTDAGPGIYDLLVQNCQTGEVENKTRVSLLGGGIVGIGQMSKAMEKDTFLFCGNQEPSAVELCNREEKLRRLGHG